MPGATSNHCENPKPVEEWFQNLGHAKKIRTKLRFYLQDVFTGDNRTVWKVAESEITPISPTNFGLIDMVDCPLTVGPNPCSEVVGRAQGTIGSAGMDTTALQFGVNIAFTEGKYKGSTISVVGRNPISEVERDRERRIVGGTGVFRMARGACVINTIRFDEEFGCFEYTLYVTHYSV